MRESRSFFTFNLPMSLFSQYHGSTLLWSCRALDFKVRFPDELFRAQFAMGAGLLPRNMELWRRKLRDQEPMTCLYEPAQWKKCLPLRLWWLMTFNSLGLPTYVLCGTFASIYIVGHSSYVRAGGIFVVISRSSLQLPFMALRRRICLSRCS